MPQSLGIDAHSTNHKHYPPKAKIWKKIFTLETIDFLGIEQKIVGNGERARENPKLRFLVTNIARCFLVFWIFCN